MRVSAIEGHRLWAPVYDSGLNPLLALERRVMGDLLKPLRPATMIDVACGTGHWLLQFQQSGVNVFGCDACERMLNEASKALSLRGHIAVADAQCLPVRSSIADLVLCSVSLGYFHDVDRVFREFARASKPGGFIAVSDLHPDALASGWTRSFKVGEQRYELEHYTRSIREVHEAASTADLKPKSCQEIYFGVPELPIFQRNGKQEIFAAITSVPALFLGLWEKPC